MKANASKEETEEGSTLCGWIIYSRDKVMLNFLAKKFNSMGFEGVYVNIPRRLTERKMPKAVTRQRQTMK
jgi:hypothetical protein